MVGQSAFNVNDLKQGFYQSPEREMTQSNQFYDEMAMRKQEAEKQRQQAMDIHKSEMLSKMGQLDYSGVGEVDAFANKVTSQSIDDVAKALKSNPNMSLVDVQMLANQKQSQMNNMLAMAKVGNAANMDFLKKMEVEHPELNSAQLALLTKQRMVVKDEAGNIAGINPNAVNEVNAALEDPNFYNQYVDVYKRNQLLTKGMKDAYKLQQNTPILRKNAFGISVPTTLETYPWETISKEGGISIKGEPVVVNGEQYVAADPSTFQYIDTNDKKVRSYIHQEMGRIANTEEGAKLPADVIQRMAAGKYLEHVGEAQARKAGKEDWTAINYLNDKAKQASEERHRRAMEAKASGPAYNDFPVLWNAVFPKSMQDVEKGAQLFQAKDVNDYMMVSAIDALPHTPDNTKYRDANNWKKNIAGAKAINLTALAPNGLMPTGISKDGNKQFAQYTQVVFPNGQRQIVEQQFEEAPEQVPTGQKDTKGNMIYNTTGRTIIKAKTKNDANGVPVPDYKVVPENKYAQTLEEIRRVSGQTDKSFGETVLGQ